LAPVVVVAGGKVIADLEKKEKKENYSRNSFMKL